MIRSLLIYACLAAALAGSAQAKQLALIGNKSDARNGMELAELAALLKGDSHNAVIIIRDPASANMAPLLRRINVSVEQVQAFAKTHPQQIVIAASDDDIIRQVAGRPGTVGLVDVYSISKEVNVVKVAGKLPFEPGYVLKGN